jgi:hypothetical protein
LTGSPAIAVYKGSSTVESTAGVTLTTNFDGRTGLNHVALDTSADGTFYSAGADYRFVMTSGAVGSVSVAGYTVRSFSIENRNIYADLRLWHGINPNSLISGRVDVNAQDTASTLTFDLVGNLSGKVLGGGSGTITGTGARVLDASGNAVATQASVTGIAADYMRRTDITITTGKVDVNDKTGFRLSATGVDDIWDELQSGHAIAGSFGRYLDSAISGVSTGGLSVGDIAHAVWDAQRPSYVIAGSFGEGVNLSAAGVTAIFVKDLSSFTTAGTFGNKLKQLTFSVANIVDSNATVTSGGDASEATSQKILRVVTAESDT